MTDAFLKSCGCNRRNLRSITLLVLLNAELTHLREEKHLLDIASTVLPKKQRLYFHCLIISHCGITITELRSRETFEEVISPLIESDLGC